MADFFQRFGVADLALGKPSVCWLPVSATVGDALGLLKELNVSEIGIWDCASSEQQPKKQCKAVSEARSGAKRKDCRDCQCIGKLNIVDIVCYLAAEDKIQDLAAGLADSVVALLRPTKHLIRHLEPDSSLIEAFNCMLDGVQYMVVPLHTRRLKSMKSYNSLSTGKRLEYCSLTQEDVLRFLLGCIGVFSPLPAMTIEELGIINTDVMQVDVNADAVEALPLMLRASEDMSAVAVVETAESQQCKLVGDISLSTLRGCDETASLALATLSVSDFLAFTQDTGGASKALRSRILSRLKQLAAAEVTSSSGDSTSSEDCGSDDDASSTLSTDSEAMLELEGRSSIHRRTSSGGIGQPLSCHPWSSLVAAMAQALAHRTSYLWVTDDDNTLIGIVTYVDMIGVLVQHLC